MTARVTSRRIDAALLRRWPLPPVDGDDGKEERGRVLVVGGSREVPGAVLLAGTAALRAGAGKLQLASVREAAIAIGVAMPEASVIAIDGDIDGATGDSGEPLREAASRTDALLVGPGMERRPAVRALVSSLSRACTATVVLDAGALAGWDVANPYGPRILTPHAGEMAALLDRTREQVDADPVAAALSMARACAAVVVLKGALTVVAGSDGTSTWTHRASQPGLGTSGSGDVLSGLVAGLLARGAEPEQAAAWGVFVHAQAGAAAARAFGPLGYLARELPQRIPSLLARLSRGIRRKAT